MATSVSATTVWPLNLDQSVNYTSAYSLKLSSFPGRVQQIRIPTKGLSFRSKPRILPLVAAKKQTFSSFEDLLENSDKPVLVDFYATWCGPCQFMVPILNEVSAALVEKIQVVKIDTEKYPNLATKYQIEALPTFVLFRDGKPLDRFEGALAAKELIERIESSLKVEH